MKNIMIKNKQKEKENKNKYTKVTNRINNKSNRAGVTLISLVIIIIILFILGSITITSIYNSGLINESNKIAKLADEKELREGIKYYTYGYMLKENESREKGETLSYAKLDYVLNNLNKVYRKDTPTNMIFKKNNDYDKQTELTIDDYEKIVTEELEGYTKGYVAKNIPEDTPKDPKPNIPKELKVGDTIIYDPTRGVTDQSKLTYTSPASQNGYGKQTITATSNHREWVVISTSGEQIKMMSKEVIDGIEGGINQNGNTKGFTLESGKGYLYAEEELHKMCAVFGHGKGASNISTKYTVGNPYIGEAEERTLSGSGARSLILSDIVSIIKGEGQDFTDEEKKSFSSGYKTEVSPEVYYPTKVSTKEDRRSDNKKSFTKDYYVISKDKYTNYENEETKTAREALVNSIFKEKVYWYGSRCVGTGSSYVGFYVGNVYSDLVRAYNLFWRLCRFSQREFCGAWPKTSGLLGLFRPIREK